MYLPEYQLALRNSGFEGFRVLAFRQTVSGVSGSASGLPMSTEFGLGVFKAFMLADLLNDYACQVRPYEVRIGETNRVVEECASEIAGHLRGFHAPEYREVAAPVLRRWLEHRKWLRGVANAAYKIKRHLHGVEFAALTSLCRERLGQVEMDRTRVRPIVKIVGEFWAATTEGDGNYRMFEFLEREGAQVRPESMGSWVMYLLHHARGRVVDRHAAEVTSGFARVRPAARFLLTLCAYDFGRWFYTRSYGRVARALGGFGHHLVSHARLSELASEFYHPLARGGEGYQEVGKTIHYGCGGQAHLIASLKPFGCLPSMQSDGVQVSVLDRFPELMFVAIETSGDGEAQAESRMQMALADARERARVEFEAALTLNGVSLSEVRAYAAMHPHLRRPTWSPPENGGGSVAARFVSHVAELIRRDPVWRGRREAPRESARAGARDSDPVAS